MIDANQTVTLDQCHLDLLYGLMVSLKPKHALELGIGSGQVTDLIIRAFEYNGLPLDLTTVDNWLDWDYQMPAVAAEYEKKGVHIVTASEMDYSRSLRRSFDLIISDADHHHAHSSFPIFMKHLNRGGMFVCHDVANPDFPNLRLIYSAVRCAGLPHLFFNASSRPDEHCQRGLLVIYNDGSRLKTAIASLYIRLFSKKAS